jgi:hypothetical protein
LYRATDYGELTQFNLKISLIWGVCAIIVPPKTAQNNTKTRCENNAHFHTLLTFI